MFSRGLLSGRAPAVPGRDVHPECDPGVLLRRNDRRGLPVVPGSSGASSHPLLSPPHRLQVKRTHASPETRPSLPVSPGDTEPTLPQGPDSGAEAPGQHHPVSFPLAHHVQHPGPRHHPCLQQRAGVSTQVSVVGSPGFGGELAGVSAVTVAVRGHSRPELGVRKLIPKGIIDASKLSLI